jgi:hypothetical protein
MPLNRGDQSNPGNPLWRKLSGFFCAAELNDNLQGGIKMLLKRRLSFAPVDMAVAMICGAEDS